MSEFSIPRVNVIRSDQGFTVELLFPTGLVYSEGHCEMRVDSEMLVGPSGLAIYEQSIREWRSPAECGDVTQEVRAKIVDNIRRAFRFRDFEIEVL
jgi:hypothetical protein